MPERLIEMEPLERRRLLSAGIPKADHIVIVVEENHSYQDVLGEGSTPSLLWSVIPPMQSAMAPYIQKLSQQGASLVNMQAEAHPSQPNYLELFSGSTQNVDGDTPPAGQFSTASLGGELIGAGLSFASYSEDLPQAGSLTITAGEYARKHNPASDFTDVPASSNLPFTAFPSDYAKLPTVSMVIPNQLHDMHSASVHSADRWLKSNLGGYAAWARKHNSLLIVTWDEGRGGTNHIPTIIYGAGVRKGNLQLSSDHERLLRTLESMYGLTPLGSAAQQAPLRRVFLGAKTSAAITPAATAVRATTPRMSDVTAPSGSQASSLFSSEPINASVWQNLQAAMIAFI